MAPTGPHRLGAVFWRGFPYAIPSSGLGSLPLSQISFIFSPFSNVPIFTIRQWGGAASATAPIRQPPPLMLVGAGRFLAGSFAFRWLGLE